jgi:hypothetical protein
MVKGEASLTSGAQTAKKRKASRSVLAYCYRPRLSADRFLLGYSVNARAFEDKEGGTRLDGQDGEIRDVFSNSADS